MAPVAGTAESRGVTAVRHGEAGYPASLDDLGQPPGRLYAIGDLSHLVGSPDMLVAIVGTREATLYGLRTARNLAGVLADAGAVVVSGMARGVDTAAHQGALKAGRPTVAVLGTGIDVPYPAANRTLHRAVAGSGLVISESGPGTRAFRGCFPRRNRIIAALARLTIVVEAGFKSGALNTASQALELGRLVAAVPGPIDSSHSAGCNLLIRDGAHVIASIDDALSLMRLSRKKTAPDATPGGFDGEVLAAIRRGDRTIDRLVTTTGAGGRDVLEAIGRLEIAGLAAASFDGTFSATAADHC